MGFKTPSPRRGRKERPGEAFKIMRLICIIVIIHNFEENSFLTHLHTSAHDLHICNSLTFKSSNQEFRWSDVFEKFAGSSKTNKKGCVKTQPLRYFRIIYYLIATVARRL